MWIKCSSFLAGMRVVNQLSPWYLLGETKEEHIYILKSMHDKNIRQDTHMMSIHAIGTPWSKNSF